MVVRNINTKEDAQKAYYELLDSIEKLRNEIKQANEKIDALNQRVQALE